MPRVVDHAERREEILGAVVDLFASEGYAALSMRRIASATGVSTGTLYHYFDSKSALFRAMLKWLVAQDVSRATAQVSPEMGRVERLGLLCAFVEANADHLQKALRIALDFDRAATEPSDRSILAEALADYRMALQAQLGLSSATEAAAILSLLLGGLVQRLWDPAAVDLSGQLLRLTTPLGAGGR